MVGAIVALLSTVGLLYKPREKKQKLTSKYERKSEVMSEPELEFLKILRQINPDRYEVLPQVALVSVIDKKTNTQYRNELFRICDYCFIDRKTSEPLLLVELNDNSHKRSDRRDRDEKVAAICEDAGIPLVTFWMNEDLDYSYVKRQVTRHILK